MDSDISAAGVTRGAADAAALPDRSEIKLALWPRGAVCPQAPSAMQNANTLAGLLGDANINPAIMQVCDNGTQWDNVHQLCVPMCGP